MTLNPSQSVTPRRNTSMENYEQRFIYIHLCMTPDQRMEVLRKCGIELGPVQKEQGKELKS
jgi:hypothetical protein